MMDALEAAVTVIQAHVRGVLLRRRLRTVRQDYECVVRDIEGNATSVHWRARLLSSPLLQPVLGQSRDAFGKQPSKASDRVTKNTHSISESDRSAYEPTQEKLHHDLTEDLHDEHPSESDPERDQVSQGTEPDHHLPSTDTFETDHLQLQIKSPDEEQILPVSEKEPSMLHQSSVTSNCESLEWTRSSSVWSDKSMDADLSLKSLNELKMHRSHLAMEVLWVQQAIASRKNYLMVRQSLGIQS